MSLSGLVSLRNSSLAAYPERMKNIMKKMKKIKKNNMKTKKDETKIFYLFFKIGDADGWIKNITNSCWEERTLL